MEILEKETPSVTETHFSSLPELKTIPDRPMTLIQNLKSPAELFQEVKIQSSQLSVVFLITIFVLSKFLAHSQYFVPITLICATAFTVAVFILMLRSAEKDFILTWLPLQSTMEIRECFFHIPLRLRRIPASILQSVTIIYKHCPQCGAIFGRRYPKDPEIILKLKDGTDLFCGEYDLEPVEQFIEAIGRAGIIEGVELLRVHRKETIGLCLTCMEANRMR